MVRVAVIDYGLEDLADLVAALQQAGADAYLVDSPQQIEEADGAVLCGRAAFAEAIGAIRELGLEDACKQAIDQKKPFMGINVGMHLFFAVGREITPGKTGDRVVDGMEIRPGSVGFLPDADTYGTPFELPHRGMASVSYDNRCSTPLLEGIPDGQEYYFDHTFIAPTGPWVQAWARHSKAFPAIIDLGRTCYGVQFHPEKSGEAGLKLFERFIQICADPESVIEHVERYATPEELAL